MPYEKNVALSVFNEEVLAKIRDYSRGTLSVTM